MLRAAQVPQQPGKVPAGEHWDVRSVHEDAHRYPYPPADSGAEPITSSQRFRRQGNARPSGDVSRSSFEKQAEAVR